MKPTTIIILFLFTLGSCSNQDVPNEVEKIKTEMPEATIIGSWWDVDNSPARVLTIFMINDSLILRTVYKDKSWQDEPIRDTIINGRSAYKCPTDNDEWFVIEEDGWLSNMGSRGRYCLVKPLN